ncbi:MAG: asparagine--tRNA ligase [Chloroflexi bacterium]|mgnify:CR=1 FL=1|nr:asparagine--tRNA ligase [Chloroflexota bacterium]
MSERIYIKDIAAHVGEQVTIKGWIYNRTDKGRLQFLLVRDGTGVVQAVVFKRDVTPEMMEDARRVTQESSVIVTGTVRQDERAPGTPGGFELSVSDFKIYQLAEEYPISPKEHGIEFLMENRHLWLRSSQQHAILLVRAEIIRAVREWLDGNGFVGVDTPILTPTSCEDTTSLFETDYFGRPAYLTQSGQLYNEATAMAMGRVYCFGPTFRAEKSKTRRHLTEFWMVEPEMAWADLDEVMRVEEQFVSHIVRSVLKNRRAELLEIGRDLAPLERIEPPFPRIAYSEALGILREEGLELPFGEDFGAPHETALGEHFNRPVFVHRYPARCKAFYMEVDPENPELSLSVDLIAPEGFGEIIGGGQRTDSLELMERRIQEHKLRREAYGWYLDLRKYGSVPHAGFGLGIERTVAWICGLGHIRETIPFPRLLDRLEP